MMTNNHLEIIWNWEYSLLFRGCPANSYEQSSDVNHVAKDVIFGPGEKKYRYCKPSFDKVIPPSFFELGLVDLVSIYSELCEAGNPPPIIDADDLQNDPEGTLCCLCYDLGVPFQASMLKWEAGPKPIDGLGPHGGILVYTNQLVSKHHEHIQRLPVPANEKILVWVGDELVPREDAKVTSGMSPSFNLYGCTLIVLAEWKPPVYDNDHGIKLVTATTRRNSPNSIDSKIHHNNLINNILAKVEGNLAKADDAIMLDKDVHGQEGNGLDNWNYGRTYARCYGRWTCNWKWKSWTSDKKNSECLQSSDCRIRRANSFEERLVHITETLLQNVFTFVCSLVLCLPQRKPFWIESFCTLFDN
ncbi:hypothetical protein HPP92_001226 [Vanilla planifolia]|uniref:Uncharacterized protein n=1 Tax=Vanilla planifolia TaxID=51239 RepID=A0A835RZG9_VANPL|nr:hypothetical protein HPP92_001226 [Vanilla planifolia]